MKKYIIAGVVVSTMALSLVGGAAFANHSWGNYHWARTSNPFTLKLGHNVSASWDSYLATTSTDWSVSSVLNTTITAGLGGKNCRATNGRVEICNKKYGNNGWLGVAQVWINGAGHITQGTVKMNDTYFATAKYNTPAWKNLVMCQEVGHTLGLDHQDEAFDNPNLGTCMDYTNDPSTNQHPNQHDYDQLEAMYAHLDNTTTILSLIDGGGNGKPALVGQDIDLDNPSAWGKEVKQDAHGKNSLYEKNLGKGEKLFTFVIWAK